MPPASSVAVALKKGEGEPLTRYDIQYCLLEKIFGDTKQVFTDAEGNRTTFGELYVQDFMSSNRLSKNLRDRFNVDAVVTRKVCMASLHVNTGRINTTLVFTPTQARTYNPIPCIQAYGVGIKMLQDAPRLKGILKGACDRSPSDWDALRAAQRVDGKRPIINPIQLIFLFTAPNTHMDVHHFEDRAYMPHEVLSDTRYTSDSRARTFLWLMYYYMETNGSAEAQTSNPYGPSEGILAPKMELGSDEDSKKENEDLPHEQEFSARMWEERKKYLASAQQKASEQTPIAGQMIDGVKVEDIEDFPATRRSSRKIKKRIYDSGPDSGEEGAMPTAEAKELSEDYKSLRSQQILRHKLQRHRRETWKRRRLGKSEHGLESAMTREYRLSLLNATPQDDEDDEDRIGGVDDDGWLWDDSDGEEAYHYAQLIRRAERRISHGRKKSKKSDRPSSSSGFKIKLKF